MDRRAFLKSVALTALAAGAATPMRAALALVAPQEGDALLAPWTGAHGGYPPFDKTTVSALSAAMEKGMALYRAELAAIAADPAAPTFENTLAALEDSGRPFDRASRIYNVFVTTMNDAQMKALEAEMAPRLAALDDERTQNAALFARIDAVRKAGAAGLTAEQARLVETTHRNFVRLGAALSDADKATMKAINQKLAALYTTFSQNVLADEESQFLTLESEADLAGLAPAQIAAAKAAAEARGLKGKWAIANTRSAMEPFLTFSPRRDLRLKGWRLWTMRGDNGGAHDNKAVIAQILRLRAQRARLLGFESHAHWATDANMAGTPEAAIALMMKVWAPAVERAREEIADMQAIADQEGQGVVIEPWDYRYYAEKVRKARYDLDESEVKPYLRLDRIRDAIFWTAEKLFGYRFAELKGLPVYHPDVTVWEATRNGARVGLFYFDPYAREGKRSGAWMNTYRAQERFRAETTPIVSNNSNYLKDVGGGPALLSWDDASTTFHEFGHALQGLSSNVSYPSMSGTQVKRDFVEFPSQILEHWLPTREVLTRFALHHETGAPMPEALLEKIERAKNFNQGFSTVEYLASALYDMRIHLAATPDADIDPDAFEKDELSKLGLPKEIVMRHRPTQFGHAFADDGYSAGYYVYLWADALTADAWELFEEKGQWDEATAASFLTNILSVGDSIAPDEAFRRFRGRDVDTEALMRKRGFA